MGALTPVITGITTLTTAVTAADRLINVTRGFASDPYESQRKALRAEQDLALRQLTAQQAMNEQQAAQDAETQRQKLASDGQSAENTRRAALRRAVARQRAQFGASGMATGDGSSEAVLLGLFEETERDRNDASRLNQLRLAALDQSLGEQRALNVLQRTQLQERQALARMV
ncbi:MAG TPA: transporter [Micavibrio sp.]